jgi:hypothetical protein
MRRILVALAVIACLGAADTTLHLVTAAAVACSQWGGG